MIYGRHNQGVGTDSGKQTETYGFAVICTYDMEDTDATQEVRRMPTGKEHLQPRWVLMKLELWIATANSDTYGRCMHDMRILKPDMLQWRSHESL